MEIKDIIGVIFDFNGTMFFDSSKHIEAWALYVEELTSASVSDEDKKKYIVGKNATEILEHFLGYELNKDMVEQLSDEKEGIYRRLCIEDKKGTTLAPGIEDFLDYLTENNVPRTIATTANHSNVMYYFETFDLYRWFDPDKIVYKKKQYRDKPAPDMYLAASQMLKMDPSRCLVFEDSIAGIQSAQRAGVKNIVAVKGDNKALTTAGLTNITAVINNFLELNDALEFEYSVKENNP